MQAADMDTAIGIVNIVSYSGLSRRFLLAINASEMVTNRVTGTLMAVIVSVLTMAF